MERKNAMFLICCTLLFSVTAFEHVGSAADVETNGNLNVQGVIESSGGVKFPDGNTQTSACSGCANGVLPISLGGTGGSTAAAARLNLVVPGLLTANTFTTGAQTISTGGTGNIGLVVRGVASQTANLQEWRNNSDNPIASIGSGGDLTIAGNLDLPATTASTGIIRSGGATLIHSLGTGNFFAGRFAGNLGMTGVSNTGTGEGALYHNTEGNGNTATGNYALYFNTSGFYNTAIGQATLDRNTSGYDNTGLGYAALFSNTIGHDNTASGYNALSGNTTAGSNTAVGSLTLSSQSFSNTNTAWDTYNTAVGYRALYSNQPTTSSNGYLNTATGGQALYKNTIGNYNTANGFDALYYNTTGNGNTASGNNALQRNDTGGYNTASGNNSLYNNVTGNYNAAFGAGALFNSTGGSNTAIGLNAGSNLVTGDNNIYIGASVQSAATTESNTTRIGNGIGSVFISGIYDHSAAGGTAVYVNSSGQLGISTSSRRYKEDIQEMGDATAGLMKLRPVTFYYKQEYADGPRLLQYGLIAEEVAEIYPGLVQYNEKGEPNTVYYQFVNAMLLNEVQKQHSRIEEHEELINRQGDMIKQLKAEIEELKRFVGK